MSHDNSNLLMILCVLDLQIWYLFRVLTHEQIPLQHGKYVNKLVSIHFLRVE